MISSFTDSNRFLSNFYPVVIKYDGMDYPSVEHAYQAAKTFDSRWRVRIADAKTPGKAKQLGRKCPLREDWGYMRISIMYELVRQKFSQDPLCQMLLNTGTQALIEVNTWGDHFWGLCKGRGTNHLGVILMSIRSEILTDRRYDEAS